MEFLMNITIKIHQYSAIMACILMPVLFLARKGTPFHISVGRLIGAISIVLVGSAILTVINPPFEQYWANDITIHEWRYFLSIFGLGTAFLWWVAAVYGYAFFSALRVWPRLKAQRAGSRSSNWLDYFLTAIALTIGSYYGTISVIQAVTSESVYPRLLPISIVFVGLGLWDLVTYFRPISSFRVAALTHGSRLFVAWWMLIVGVLIRQRQHVAANDGGVSEYTVNSLLLVVFLALLFYWNRQVSPAASASNTAKA